MSWLGKQKEKHRLKKLYEETYDTKYYSPKGAYIDQKGVYRRAYPYSTNHDNNKKYWHRLANRIARRRLGDEETMDRSGHKKIFDLWWKIY